MMPKVCQWWCELRWAQYTIKQAANEFKTLLGARTIKHTTKWVNFESILCHVMNWWTGFTAPGEAMPHEVSGGRHTLRVIDDGTTFPLPKSWVPLDYKTLDSFPNTIIHHRFYWWRTEWTDCRERKVNEHEIQHLMLMKVRATTLWILCFFFFENQKYPIKSYCPPYLQIFVRRLLSFPIYPDNFWVFRDNWIHSSAKLWVSARSTYNCGT